MNFRYLQGNRQLGDLFFVRFIQPGKATDVVYDFLEMLETGELRQENVNIKFTFRLSPRLERYLQWKSQREKISKADWLRNFLIEHVIAKDPEWQKHIQQKNKSSTFSSGAEDHQNDFQTNSSSSQDTEGSEKVLDKPTSED